MCDLHKHIRPLHGCNNGAAFKQQTENTAAALFVFDCCWCSLIFIVMKTLNLIYCICMNIGQECFPNTPPEVWDLIIITHKVTCVLCRYFLENER